MVKKVASSIAVKMATKHALLANRVPRHIRFFTLKLVAPTTVSGVPDSVRASLSERIRGNLEIYEEKYRRLLDGLTSAYINTHSRRLIVNGRTVVVMSHPEGVKVFADAGLLGEEGSGLREVKNLSELYENIKRVGDVKTLKKLRALISKMGSKEERASAALTLATMRAMLYHEVEGRPMDEVYREVMNEFKKDKDIAEGLEAVRTKQLKRAMTVNKVVEIATSTIAMIGETFARMVSNIVRSLGSAIPFVGRIAHAGAAGESLTSAAAFMRMRMMSRNDLLPYLMARR